MFRKIFFALIILQFSTQPLFSQIDVQNIDSLINEAELQFDEEENEEMSVSDMDDYEFSEFSEDDAFMFENGEEGETEVWLGPVKLRKVAGREGLYVFDVKEKVRTEVLIVDLNMKILRKVYFAEGSGEIDILDLVPGEYFLRFSWSGGAVIEKVYRLQK